jgi:hypothetical protein|tara:strand:+ start:925 stop:1179 length:255 start_codon:yes stop_codon:yes gene_type:complete
MKPINIAKELDIAPKTASLNGNSIDDVRTILYVEKRGNGWTHTYPNCTISKWLCSLAKSSTVTGPMVASWKDSGFAVRQREQEF